MNKNMKRILALMLALAMLVSVLAACGSDDSGSSSSSQESSSSEESSAVDSEPAADDGDDDAEAEDTDVWTAPSIDSDDYDEVSEYYYDYTLGEFYEYAQEYANEMLDVNKRYCLQAVAEAKLLGSGVMMPTTNGGGRFAISRVAPGSYTTFDWGGDQQRIQYMVTTEELITTEDRDALKALLNDLRGTGTYQEEAIKYLEEKGYTVKDKYTTTFSSMPVTWDILNTSRAADAEPVCPGLDPLLFYDGEDQEVPCLATDYEVSEDGMTYTFHIREGVKWVDSQGREVADVIADDWVASLQHACDCDKGLGNLLIGVIKGIDQYMSGEDTDFANVGIKAVDDYTLEYTLEQPIPYFLSMLHYNHSLPMSRTYYTSQGGKFGEEYDPEADSYQYGLDPTHLAYCGAFLTVNATENNSINYTANPTYWNADNVSVKEFAYLYNDGSDVTKAYTDCKASTIDGVTINTSTLELVREEKMDGDDETIFDKYVYVSSSNTTSYMGFMNVNRAAWANVNDETAAVSTQSEEEAARTHIAMNNRHFRLAVIMAVDRVTWNGQKVGDDLAALSLRNTYTPATFVHLTEDTTVSINGEDVTFPAGTDYGAIVQKQLDADGVKVTVYKEDPNADNGVGTGDGFDGWFNVDNAVAELELAIAELETAGVTVDESNPIHLDLPFAAQSATYTNAANSMKQSIENNLGGKVILDLVECKDYDEWYASGYDTDYGYESNFDIFDLSGWGPDFQDPCTYLDTFLPDYNGYMTKCIGVY